LVYLSKFENTKKKENAILFKNKNISFNKKAKCL